MAGRRYLCDQLSACAVGGSLEDLLALKIGDWAIGFEIFALLALPFIYAHTRLNPRVSKWFFYIYYPAHLLVIFLIKMIL